jgi:hypothetical protein
MSAQIFLVHHHFVRSLSGKMLILRQLGVCYSIAYTSISFWQTLQLTTFKIGNIVL